MVVDDARTDPRTNKDIVAQLQNRTIINVPLLMAEQRLGALGMGSHGDAEGVRPPLPWQLDFMQAMAGHVAVAMDRVRFMQARKDAEDALYHEKERLQVTLHSIGDAVISTNANGDLLYITPAAEALTGWTLTAAVGRPYRQVFSLLDPEGRRPAVTWWPTRWRPQRPTATRIYACSNCTVAMCWWRPRCRPSRMPMVMCRAPCWCFVM